MSKAVLRLTRRSVLGLAAGLLASSAYPVHANNHGILVHQDPNCSCCTGWVRHLRDAGFVVTAVEATDLQSVKIRLDVPLAEAEVENGQSRIWLGIHWQYDPDDGIKQGQVIAKDHLCIVLQLVRQEAGACGGPLSAPRRRSGGGEAARTSGRERFVLRREQALADTPGTKSVEISSEKVWTTACLRRRRLHRSRSSIGRAHG